ncbi:hypothetical protein [Amycolatopsis minnesotensis]|uniref:Uncharacterized protein n=1 Tax=Amycolatopsis minnesotensis TaxID=337894 RepID=A0ABN2Q683_9PSEU
MSLFQQVWLWSALAFVVGALLSWVFLTRPVQKRNRELERRLAEETARPKQSSFPATVAAGAVGAAGAAGAFAGSDTGSDIDDAFATVNQGGAPEPTPTRTFEPATAESFPSPETAPPAPSASSPGYAADEPEWSVRDLSADRDTAPETAGHALFAEDPPDGPTARTGGVGSVLEPEQPERVRFDFNAADDAAFEPVGRDEPASYGRESEKDTSAAEETSIFQSVSSSTVDNEPSSYGSAEETSVFQPSSLDYYHEENGDGPEPVPAAHQEKNESAEPGALFAEPEPTSMADPLAAPSETGFDPAFPDDVETPADPGASVFEPRVKPQSNSLFQPAPREEETPAYAFSAGPEAELNEDAEQDDDGVPEESAAEMTQVLPKRQPRQSPPGGFDPPRPIQPSMRPIERREPEGGGHSGSLFEPAVPPNQHAPAPAEDQSPPAREHSGSSVPPGPFGPGSAMPKPGGGRPTDEFTVKASVTALRYCSEESPQFPRMVAEVWFRTAADAERVGFRPVT